MWAKALPQGMSREETDTRKLSSIVAPARPGKAAAAQPIAKGADESGISKPFNIRHEHHVQVDPHTSTGFKVRAR